MGKFIDLSSCQESLVSHMTSTFATSESPPQTAPNTR